MSLPTIDLYSDIHCPWAYLTVYRLRQIWPDYADRVQVVWRSLGLEYINERGTPKRILDPEMELMAQIEPDLPMQLWSRPDSEWPVTFWPAFEALASAQAQSHSAAFEMSWVLRRTFFGESRSPALRHELLAMAREVAATTDLDFDRFKDDWDNGRYKGTVVVDSRRGWRELRVEGSPTFVLTNGRQFPYPATGHADIDVKRGVVRQYTPYEGDWVPVYREMLEAAIATQS